jgi:L-ascorbate metabolism protein UlaG (beta-lactamase superfamily)
MATTSGGVDITWVNHGSLVIAVQETHLLIYASFSGRIFDDGWDLLAPTLHRPVDLDDVTHIWLSHEHLDRFHSASLGELNQVCSTMPTVLFRTTVDGRVGSGVSRGVSDGGA